ncbi:hypothetical protein OGAPHI_006738 [Ogataea philodendri]|uniref:Gluconokinase n=1 Tax=Ogataea philodendri TaxID=1378263 RepID=A0A9P8NY28_9ASCO|nr:uncharacterized protein OGAPHI_006738 [Ogataea philodendri]KAH3661331.1 hypothetical protein OGAPHI_006738 [Ogataea philodendri]
MPTIIVVGGPSGTGKSTVGESLSQSLRCRFVEGDAFHPKANIDKMSQGIALTDDDRWGWLENLTNIAADATSESKTVVVSCSMLNKKYRDFIKEVAAKKNPNITLFMIFLYNDYSIIYDRMSQRKGHFMKSSMLKSQFDAMEVPEHEQNAVAIYCGEKTEQQIQDEALQAARQNIPDLII